MEQDYKEQLRMMTEGLGEWMDRREREQRRRRRWLRVGLGVVAVAAAVVLQVFFPWRRETVKYVYVNDTAQAPVIVHDTVVSQPTKPIKPAGVHISGSEDGEWGRIDIDESGVRITSSDGEEAVSIVIGTSGVRINGKGIGITDTVAAAPVRPAPVKTVKVSFMADNFIKEMYMPKERVQPFIDSIRASYKSVVVEEEEDGSVEIMASRW